MNTLLQFSLTLILLAGTILQGSAQSIRSWINSADDPQLVFERSKSTPWVLWPDENNSWQVSYDGDPRLIIEKDGDVGIGIYPNADFHVGGNAVFGANPGTDVRLTVDAVSSQSYNMAIARFSINGAPKMVVDESGFVGIGTDSPSDLLSVEGGKVVVNNGHLAVTGDQINTEPIAVIAATTNFKGNSHIIGVSGISNPAPGFGYGGKFSGGFVGAEATATGSGLLSFGLFATASGAQRNYAVYSNGDTKVTGRLFIGTSLNDEDDGAGYELVVDGKMIAEELKVKNSVNWPDYVFESDYQLSSIAEVSDFIGRHGHLPGIPSAAEVADDGGYDLGEMQRMQMEKIEELMLYIIDLDTRNTRLEQENRAIRQELEALRQTHAR